MNDHSGLLVHLCLFHIYINAIGITTYEYVRAHRVAIERSAREISEPTTSTAAGSATLRHQSLANGIANDGWNDLQLTSSTSSTSTECRQNCRRFCVKVQIEPVPQLQNQKNHATSNGHNNATATAASGNLNIPDGDGEDFPESLPETEIRNGVHAQPLIRDSSAGEVLRPRSLPERHSNTTVTVSSVPRLPMILSVDGISSKLDDDSEKNSVKKISKHLDGVKSSNSNRHRHDFRDQIFIIEGGE